MHPKRLRNPKVLMHTPTKGHLQKTSTIPPRKQMVWQSFCFHAQKYNVFCGPMMSVRPEMKRIYMHSKGESGEHAHTVAKAHTFLSARSAPSKKSMTPRSMNSTPNEVSPMIVHLGLGQMCTSRGRTRVVGTWMSRGGGHGARGRVSWLTLKNFARHL